VWPIGRCLEHGDVGVGAGHLGDDEAAADARDGVRCEDLGDLARAQAALVHLEGELAALEVHARTHRIVGDRDDRALANRHGDAAAHEHADHRLLGRLDPVAYEHLVVDLRRRALDGRRVGDRALAHQRGDGADRRGLSGGVGRPDGENDRE
jgi:hypothetical protein